MKKLRGQVVIDKILDTAQTLFYEQGYHTTGINQIIEEADIAKASLYKHFESKTDLLVAYIERLHQRWIVSLEAYVNKVADPKGKLLSLFDYHCEKQQTRGFGGCPFIKANEEAGMSDPRVLLAIQNTKQHFKDFIKQLVVGSVHKKILTHGELVELLFLMLEGGVVEASIFKQVNDLQAAKKVIKKLL